MRPWRRIAASSLLRIFAEHRTPETANFLDWPGKLNDCELVVASACDTQRGIKAGDSVIALPRGFFLLARCRSWRACGR